jgi:hypothetical protein
MLDWLVAEKLLKHLTVHKANTFQAFSHTRQIFPEADINLLLALYKFLYFCLLYLSL